MQKFLKHLRQSPLGLSLLILLVTFSLLITQAHATTTIDNGATVKTDFSNTSNTGNNNMGVGGNNGDGNANNSYIQTGNTTTNGIITNHVNTNIFQFGCNCTPTPSQITPTPTAGASATPTPGGQTATPTRIQSGPTPTSGSTSGGSTGSTSGGASSGSSSSSSSVQGAATGPTQAVLGLSYTAGNDSAASLSYILGFVCLLLAVKLVSINPKMQ